MKFASRSVSVTAISVIFTSTQALATFQHDCASFAQSIAPSLLDHRTTISNSTFVIASGSNLAYYANSYNGRFMAVGNDGYSGTIDYSNMLEQVNQGFAVAGGDAGHLASNNDDGSGDCCAPGVYIPFLHDLDQVKAWVHNAIAIFTSPAKSLVISYYESPATYSYFKGCSTGGAQGFALAQFYPELFDGIYAGSPGNWYSHLALSFLWNGLETQNESFLPNATLDMITSAVLDACDTLDGVEDRIIENPLKCTFDLTSLACNTTATNSSCLTTSQLLAAEAIYAGPTSNINGAKLYPGFSLGSENQWLLQEQILSNAFSIPLLQNLVFDDLEFNYRWGSDVGAVDANAGLYIDEISTDISAFRKAGGKILLTQGWVDPFNAATWPIQQLHDIESFFGTDISDFLNLFMVPGGGHCGGGYDYVPGTYEVVPKLVQWVENDVKPTEVLSTTPGDGTNTTRLLCPWPQTARYVSGDITLWTNYVCE